MDRLTIPDVKLDNNVIQKSVITKQEVQNIAMEIYWRLKDIEDIIANEESEEYDLARLKELVMADADGRCVVLPCKVGDKVYFADMYGVIPEKVEAITVSIETGMDIYNAEEIGSSVFLNPKSAVDAMKEMKTHENHP